MSMENNEVDYLLHSVFMYLNPYSNEAINSWDGTTVEINDDGGTILAPQIGAGTKNTFNQFSGIVMGKDPTQNKTGLYGYKDGINTFALTEDGQASFGTKGQITINGETATITGKNKNNTDDENNYMTLNLVNSMEKDENNKFTDNAITVGNNFNVDYNGILKCTNANVAGTINATAGTIGGCNIDNGTLKIAEANISNKLTASVIDVDNLNVNSANIANSVNTNWVYAGNITANQISGGTINADVVYAGQVYAGNISNILGYDANGNPIYGKSVDVVPVSENISKSFGIFAENVLMNYIILFATLVVIKVKNKRQQIKLFLSSIIGSTYALIVYLGILPIYSNLVAKIILSVVMIYVAFRPLNMKQLLKQLLIFYLVSFVFGGCTFALIYFIKPENVKIHNGVFVGTYPIKVALLAGVVAFIITEIAFKINRNKLNRHNTFFCIKIYDGEKMLKVNALLDSGNMLKEPISGMPVIIIEKETLSKLIPEEILNYIEDIIGGDEKEDKDGIQQYLSKIRMVPFMSIGKDNGMLVGIRVDKVKIETEDINIEKENVIVGIYNNKLAKDNKYNALIGLNFLEGEDEHELATNIKKQC